VAAPLLEFLEVVLKNLTDRLALAVLGGCLFLRGSMFFPDTGIGKWSDDHWIWIFFGILFPICYLPTRRVFEWEERWRANRKRNKRLHNLTSDEQSILAPYIKSNMRTDRIIYSDAVAKGLADDGILYIPDVSRDTLGRIAYNIQ
jgi:hypothetical protein